VAFKREFPVAVVIIRVRVRLWIGTMANSAHGQPSYAFGIMHMDVHNTKSIGGQPCV